MEHPWRLELDRITHKQSVNCKYCDSMNIVRYGTFQGMQRYFCKDCRRKFADNDALPGMKTPVWIISLALNCYYGGMSLRNIQQEINKRHGAYYAQSSIYNWIIRFSTAAARQAQFIHLAAGEVLFIATAPAAFGKNPLYSLDVFDVHSKYLLASWLLENITEDGVTKSIRTIKFAAPVTSQYPTTVMVMLACNNKLGNSANIIFQDADASMVKEFNSILKKRNRVVRNFRDIDRAQILLDAWRMHYNFLIDAGKPKFNKTGGESASSHPRSWDDIISQSR